MPGVNTDAFGITPHAYVIGRRLDVARTRILDGHPLAPVATEVGFLRPSPPHATVQALPQRDAGAVRGIRPARGELITATYVLIPGVGGDAWYWHPRHSSGVWHATDWAWRPRNSTAGISSR